MSANNSNAAAPVNADATDDIDSGTDIDTTNAVVLTLKMNPANLLFDGSWHGASIGSASAKAGEDEEDEAMVQSYKDEEDGKDAKLSEKAEKVEKDEVSCKYVCKAKITKEEAKVKHKKGQKVGDRITDVLCFGIHTATRLCRRVTAVCLPLPQEKAIDWFQENVEGKKKWVYDEQYNKKMNPKWYSKKGKTFVDYLIQQHSTKDIKYKDGPLKMVKSLSFWWENLTLKDKGEKIRTRFGSVDDRNYYLVIKVLNFADGLPKKLSALKSRLNNLHMYYNDGNDGKKKIMTIKDLWYDPLTKKIKEKKDRPSVPLLMVEYQPYEYVKKLLKCVQYVDKKKNKKLLNNGLMRRFLEDYLKSYLFPTAYFKVVRDFPPCVVQYVIKNDVSDFFNVKKEKAESLCKAMLLCHKENLRKGHIEQLLCNPKWIKCSVINEKRWDACLRHWKYILNEKTFKEVQQRVEVYKKLHSQYEQYNNTVSDIPENIDVSDWTVELKDYQYLEFPHLNPSSSHMFVKCRHGYMMKQNFTVELLFAKQLLSCKFFKDVLPSLKPEAKKKKQYIFYKFPKNWREFVDENVDGFLPKYDGTKTEKKVKKLADESKATHVCFCYANRYSIPRLYKEIKKAKEAGKDVLLHIDTSFPSVAVAAKDHIQNWYDGIKEEKYDFNSYEFNTFSQPKTFEGEGEMYEIQNNKWISDLKDKGKSYVLAANKYELNRIIRKLPDLFPKNLIPKNALFRTKNEVKVQSSPNAVPMKRGETNLTVCTVGYVSAFAPNATAYCVGGDWSPEKLSQAKKVIKRNGKLYKVVKKGFEKDDFVFYNNNLCKVLQVSDETINVYDFKNKKNEMDVKKQNVKNLGFNFREKNDENKVYKKNQSAVGAISECLFEQMEKAEKEEDAVKKQSVSNLQSEVHSLKKQITTILGHFKRELLNKDIVVKQRDFELWVVNENQEWVKTINLDTEFNGNEWVKRKITSLNNLKEKLNKKKVELEKVELNKRPSPEAFLDGSEGPPNKRARTDKTNENVLNFWSNILLLRRKESVEYAKAPFEDTFYANRSEQYEKMVEDGLKLNFIVQEKQTLKLNLVNLCQEMRNGDPAIWNAFQKL